MIGETHRKRAKAAMDEMGRQARKTGARVARTLAETPELITLERKERAMKNELDYHLRQIGLQALRIHRRSQKKEDITSPFSGIRPIEDELETVEELQDDLRANREKIARLKQRIRHDK